MQSEEGRDLPDILDLQRHECPANTQDLRLSLNPEWQATESTPDPMTRAL